MTIRTGTDAYGHHSLTMKRARMPVVAVGKTVKRTGIERQPQERADPDRPLSARHAAILELVETKPTSAKVIADALGLTAAGVNSSLYSLATRGLVAHSPYKGWVRL